MTIGMVCCGSLKKSHPRALAGGLGSMESVVHFKNPNRTGRPRSHLSDVNCPHRRPPPPIEGSGYMET